MLSVVTARREVSTARAVAEAELDGSVAALSGVHRAAGLAQRGEYVAARCLLVSTQRLLQRAMSGAAQQRDYLSFVVQAEKLDGFMREAQAQEGVFGKTASCDARRLTRDDEAATSILKMKAVTSTAFHARI